MKIVHDNKGFLLFVGLMFVFRSAIADWNHVPSGSMLPTIQIGDRLGVNKMAYDVRIPFTTLSLYRRGNPVRGDIVIFDSQYTGNRMVKRVVGLPGDLVAMKDDRLTINQQALRYVAQSKGLFTEHIADAEYTVQRVAGEHRLSSFSAIQVPADHYLVLGDNRDNSADSRVIGFVPRNEIVGRTRHVVMSFDYDNFYLPRADRFWQRL